MNKLLVERVAKAIYETFHCNTWEDEIKDKSLDDEGIHEPGEYMVMARAAINAVDSYKQSDAGFKVHKIDIPDGSLTPIETPFLKAIKEGRVNFEYKSDEHLRLNPDGSTSRIDNQTKTLD